MDANVSGQTHDQATTSLGTEPFFPPIGEATIPAGYVAPDFVQRQGKTADLAKISKAASSILHDPLRMRLLSDRVYKLMLEDLRCQQERNGNSGGSF